MLAIRRDDYGRLSEKAIIFLFFFEQAKIFKKNLFG